MRAWWMVLLLVPLVQSVPLLAIVEEVSVEDDTGDATINGVPADHLDITHATVRTNHTHLFAELGLVDAATARDSTVGIFAGTPYYWISFSFQQEEYDLMWVPQAWANPEAGEVDDDTEVRLLRQDPDGWTAVHQGPAAVVDEDSVLTAVIPIEAIVTSIGFNPGPGEQITILSATSAFQGSGQDPHDPAPPDSPTGTLQETVQGGDDVAFPPESHIDIAGDVSDLLAIGTARPIRFSNGEATTYHWPVLITNRAVETVHLATTVEASDDLTVHVPSAVTVAAGDVAAIDVYATAPFVHTHGGNRSVSVQLEGGGHHGEIDLEIRYLEVPQPSGHHRAGHLHGRNTGEGVSGTTWMDTLPAHEETHDELNMMPSVCLRDQLSSEGLALSFPLRPALRIGVDARIDEPLRLTGTFTTTTPRPSGMLVAEFYVYDAVEGDPAPRVEPDRPNAVTLDLPSAIGRDVVPLDLELPVPEVLDFLPPDARVNIGVLMGFCTDEPFAVGSARYMAEVVADTPPTLSGLEVLFPFDDYHDPIPIDVGRGLAIEVDDPVRHAAPGTTVLWSVRTSGEGALGVRLLGLHGEDATVHGTGFQAGDEIPVSMVVPEEDVEVIVEVHALDDPTLRAAVRLVVDTDREAEGDDASLVEGLRPKESPGLPWLVLVAAGVLLARRRR